jgi:hypothetical protein
MANAKHSADFAGYTYIDERDVLPLSPEQSAWMIVVADFERESAAYAIAAEEYHAACREYDAHRVATPEEFHDYGLDHYARRYPDDRKGFIRSLELRVAMLHCPLAEGERLTEAQSASITGKATRLVDDYLAFTAAKAAQEAPAEATYSEAEENHDAAVDKVCDAREKMLLTPAPDALAIAYKLEVFHDYLALGDEQDTHRIKAFRDDMRRLFGTVTVPETL